MENNDSFLDDITRQPDLTKIENIPSILPFVLLKNAVIYPYTVVPLSIGEPKSIAAVDEAMASNKFLGVVALKNIDDISPDNIYSTGTLLAIHKMLKFPTGEMRLIVQGLNKIQVKKLIKSEPFYQFEIEPIQETAEKTTTVEALMRKISEQAQKMISLSPLLPTELQMAIINVDSPLHLVYLVATIINLKLSEAQEILEINDIENKLTKTLTILSKEIELLEIGGQIQSHVQSEMTKAQKEYYLREQMKAIRQELGDIDEGQAEANEIREKLKSMNLSEEVNKEVERELKRMEKMHPSSAEYHVIRTYLDWVLDLPWSVETKDNLDLKRARKILDEDHYDLNKIKERIIEYLAVRKLKQDLKGPILCFVGPPGVGKTSLGQSIARALNRKFVRLSLGGVHDEAEIRGHRRTYIGALPGKVIQSIKRAESNNPVFMLDEVDKIGIDFRGDPSSALLEVLDPEQNNNFRDHYLNLAYDLSKVLFITTANVTQTLQPALLDRLEILRLAGYSDEEKLKIAEKYLIPNQLKNHGLDNKEIQFSKGALKEIISDYTKEAGVRKLEQQIATISRKIAYKISIGGRGQQFVVKPNDLKEYLGPQKFFKEVAQRTAQAGVATGLAWTAAGGDVLFIETRCMPGKKAFMLTGQLGEVMQESAKAALSYIRSKAKELKIKDSFFEKHDIHIHVPSGGIPKDGPSAGVTMISSLLSSILNKPVRKDVAMTGEITLSGLVLPIGGVKEKVLAAKRAGIRNVILPKKNMQDLEDIPKDLCKNMTFLPVENIDEVLKNIFEKNGKTNAKKGSKQKNCEIKKKSAGNPPLIAHNKGA